MAIGTTAAILGSAIIGAGASSIAAGQASKAQQRAGDQANQITLAQLAQQDRQYQQDREDLAPYRKAGYIALDQLGSGTINGGEFNRRFTMDDYEADPGYAFRLEQGNRGVEASAAARGGVLSGGAMKALARYNQGAASQEYGAAYDRWRADTTDRYNRLASIAGIGQTATNAGIAAGGANAAAQMAGAGRMADTALQVGNSRASQYVAQGNAIGGAIGQVGNYFALRDLYKFPTGTPPYGGAYGIAGSDGIY